MSKKEEARSRWRGVAPLAHEAWDYAVEGAALEVEGLAGSADALLAGAESRPAQGHAVRGLDLNVASPGRGTRAQPKPHHEHLLEHGVSP